MKKKTMKFGNAVRGHRRAVRRHHAPPRHEADISATLDIDVNKPGVAIPKTFYGLMTEEINHAYDGGLYAELIQNRTFQDPAPRGGRGSRSPQPKRCQFIGR